MELTNYTDRRLFNLLNSVKKDINKLEVQANSLKKKIQEKQKKEADLKFALAQKLEILTPETIEAIAEVREMEKHPENYPEYNSIADLKTALES